MKLFITGANGFIGRSTVTSACALGHDVVALVRSADPVSSARTVGDPLIAVGDLREPDAWAEHLAGCDAVIHLAGSIEASEESTQAVVLGTERLLAAMAAHDVDRLVLVSSISVYDFKSLRPGDVLDEATPLEPEPQHRDAYVRGKLAQERLAAAQPNLRTTVVRPGAVYGAGRLWDAGHALQLGPRAGIAIGPSGRMKLTFVENCAEALVRAAERSDTAGTAVNVVDDGLPTQREFAAALARHGLDRVRTLSIPYRVAAALANLAWHINRGLLRDRLPLPGLLVPSTLAARYKPLEYSNATARRALGWAPRYSLDEALARVATEPS